MIQLKFREIPKDLAAGQQEWTEQLIHLVTMHKTYAKIPQHEKDEVLKNYNLPGVKKALGKMSSSKCCYCESLIDHIDFPHIEHFLPKSKYPKYAFKWTNLFLSCKKCNLKKKEFDTKVNPFINPVRDNPEEYLSYSELRIIPNPTSPDPLKSINTINRCNLRRRELFRLRAKLLIEFNELEDALEEIIEKYQGLTKKDAKLKRLVKIHEALENHKFSCAEDSPYAGYVRYMSAHSKIVSTGIDIINKNLAQLGIHSFKLH
jgi:uncharacterized protein (TIGR02646 family)